MKGRKIIVVVFWILSSMIQGTDAIGQSIQSIGNITSVQRQVEVTHPGKEDVLTVRLGDSVLFKDFYETKTQARLKLLFDDDSILSLGENTRLQITENIYDPAQNRRSTVVSMVKGSVRALVGRLFGGAGSKFEIHTPTAVAAARGTYFIVWIIEEGSHVLTRVVNIGDSGIVAVSNINPTIEGSVNLGPNEHTTVEMGMLPTPAANIEPRSLGSLLVSTEVKDQTIEEIPKGKDAPGADVSTEVVTPISSVQAVTGGSTKNGGSTSTNSSIEQSGGVTEITYPAVPPIQQQPNPTTHLIINIPIP